MTGLEIAVRLNQQQLELLDRTAAEQGGVGRGELIAQALGKYYDAHFGPDNK